MVKLDSSTFYFIFFCSQTGLSLQQWLLPPAVCTESSTVLHFPRLLQGAVICTWCDSISVPFLYFVCVCFSMISCVLSTGDRDFIHPPAWAFYMTIILLHLHSIRSADTFLTCFLASHCAVESLLSNDYLMPQNTIVLYHFQWINSTSEQTFSLLSGWLCI